MSGNGRLGFFLFLFLSTGYLFPSLGASEQVLTIGSKKFTESVILGEMMGLLFEQKGQEVVHRRELGGTRVLWNALLSGEIDIYPDYTGTLRYEILAGTPLQNEEDLLQALKKKGILMSQPLGFNNTYAIGMREEVADGLGVRRISDLVHHPELVFGFTNEFMDRNDGWPGLKEVYHLPQTNVNGLDHDLAYRGLDMGSIQVMDLYSTDAEIAYYGLRVLEDDHGYFPDYHAVLLYRSDLFQRFPEAVKVLKWLEGRIIDSDMVVLNAASKINRISETRVAADFLENHLGVKTHFQEETPVQQLWRYTQEHLFLVGVSLSGAILLSVPLGVFADRRPRIGQMILGTAGMFQTVPSLALLVFMIPFFGIGGPPAVMALFLYSLLPIIRNTYTGLKEIPLSIRESAVALGLPSGWRLFRIELPMASRTILAGIKISAVINIGTATLGALIGAGGYGQPILTGIRLDDVGLILQGAVPAALLALFAQGIFEIGERFLVPKGLRL
ncbi:MAG TPA: glycine betaine ABC transporter substrate-binding protein [Nitrospiria bacterium]|jgi:osmoprotectant transport system permease protein